MVMGQGSRRQQGEGVWVAGGNPAKTAAQLVIDKGTQP